MGCRKSQLRYMTTPIDGFFFSFLDVMLDNTFLCSLTHVQWRVVVEGCIVVLLSS